VRTARRYRTVKIRVGQHLLTAEDPLPADRREALARINCALSSRGASPDDRFALWRLCSFRRGGLPRIAGPAARLTEASDGWVRTTRAG